VSRKDLRRLFLAYKAEIHAYLMRQLRDIETAADLTQETFLRFAQQPASTTVVQERAYLYRTARNLAIDHLRMKRRQQTEVASHDAMADIPENRPSLEDETDAKERLVLLRGLVERLPRRTRQAFILIRIENRSYADAAALMDVSISSVQKHMNLALRQIAAALKS
jgi:RNA polymerase sigma-70 factor (ECF subfamily)